MHYILQATHEIFAFFDLLPVKTYRIIFTDSTIGDLKAQRWHGFCLYVVYTGTKFNQNPSDDLRVLWRILATHIIMPYVSVFSRKQEKYLHTGVELSIHSLKDNIITSSKVS